MMKHWISQLEAAANARRAAEQARRVRPVLTACCGEGRSP